MQGIEEVKEPVMTWSIPTTLAWLTSGISLVIVNAIFG
jgi:GntP family gluconate:H+ symporter